MTQPQGVGESLDASELGQLRWRCRRGMKELDVLLMRFVEEEFLKAPADQRQAFRELLEAQDPLIYAYCLGHERPPSALLAALIERIARRTPPAPAAEHGC